MKKLGFFLIAILIASCSKEKEINYAIISGSIENSDAKTITIYNSYNADLKKEIPLVDGKFQDTIDVKNNLYFIVENRNKTDFYVEKGDKVNLTYNSKNLDSTLVFTGDNSITNLYLSKSKNAADDLKMDTKVLYQKNETDFKNHVAQVKQNQDDFLYNFNGLSEDFIKSEKANINYKYLNSLSRYELYHGFYNKNRAFKASDTINNELKGMEYGNLNDYIFSGAYRSLTESNYRDKAIELTKTDTTITSDVAYFKAISTIENEEIRNHLAYNDAKYGITYTDNLEDYYAMFSKISTNEINNKKIDEDYKKLKALAKGSPSPKFVDYENNAGGNTSLDDLKGKYVYIDVWATWCGPCIREIPSLKKLEKEYHGRNIDFVSISIDKMKDHGKWGEMIKTKELGGVQLFADNDWNSKFIKDYMIKGIPRFILLDPEGNIVSSNAARPSNKKLTTLFDELKI